MSCCKKHGCCKKKNNKSEGTIINDDSEPMMDTETAKYYQFGGKIMRTLIKLIFKLIWKLMILAGAICGVAYLMNKFTPEIMDALTDWLKERRDD
ncbi:MAG: hypothetical protein J5819_08620 [Eubacterium sp.]|nr:hypothetical protein [Eubacterium sp.]